MATDTQTEADVRHDGLRRALDVAGTRCAMHVLLEAGRGTARFDDFVAGTEISEAVVARRLKAFVEQDVLRRRPYQEPGQRTRYEYELTETGAELVPIARALAAWGVAHPAQAPDDS